MRQCCLLIVLVALLASCAASNSSQGKKFSSSSITAEEIAQSSAKTAMEAIQLLRPSLLRQRGSRGHNRIVPVVYLDNIKYGDVASLQNIIASSIQEIKYLKATDATLRFGTNHMGGAFLITSRAN